MLANSERLADLGAMHLIEVIGNGDLSCHESYALHGLRF